jgi:hypothetical protein
MLRFGLRRLCVPFVFLLGWGAFAADPSARVGDGVDEDSASATREDRKRPPKEAKMRTQAYAAAGEPRASFGIT